MDGQAIRAVAFELLHVHAAMSPQAIADASLATPRAVCGALDADDRFGRIAGEGCWWWQLSTISSAPVVAGQRRRGRRPKALEISSDEPLDESSEPAPAAVPVEPPPNLGEIARAQRMQSTAARQVRDFLSSNAGGCTTGRIREALGLAGDEVVDLLRGLEALGEVGTYTLCDLVFWKVRAA
jgi:hypothetical protein